MAAPHTQPTAQPLRTNWSGNYTFHAAELLQPSAATQLQTELPRRSQLKAAGTRHSFNAIADTAGAQLDLSHLAAISVDRAARTVTLGAGVTYGQLAPRLHAEGFALPNLASLPHISVAGACATGTHGSGLRNGCLATSVGAMDLVTAAGEPVTFSRAADPAALRLAAVHLGALGVVTSLTLDLVPTFEVAQTVYEDLSFDQLEHNLLAIFGAGYSVSLFTDWQHHRATQAWVKRKLDPPGPATATAEAAQDPPTASPATFFGARRQTAKLHPLPGLSAENCTEQLGEPGPWYDRLPHFRLDYTPSAGAELQTEYFVPLSRGYAAIRAVEQLRDRITPHLLVSELRTVAADTLGLSMAHARDSLALHFTWKPDQDAVLALLPAIEAALEPFSARPHWAKLFTTPPERLRTLYPGLDAFRALAHHHDPAGHFRNAYLEPLL